MGTRTDTSLDQAKIQAIEDQLQAKGYRLTNKKNSSDLKPYEYFKNEWRGSQKSFHGPVHYEITWWTALKPRLKPFRTFPESTKRSLTNNI